MKRILIILAILLMMASSCNTTSTNSQPTTQPVEIYGKPTKEVIHVVTNYRFDSDMGRVWASKIVIDGHELLVFGSGLANPPTVIHNMACPCMGVYNIEK